LIIREEIIADKKLKTNYDSIHAGDRSVHGAGCSSAVGMEVVRDRWYTAALGGSV